MSEKRIYLTGYVGSQKYIGHMTKRNAMITFDSHEEVSKAAYRAARAEGTPSWGEYETQCKREGREPRRRTARWVW